MSIHDLDTDINDISLAFAGDMADAFDIALTTWGQVEGNFIVVNGGKTYICDGIDPTTGDVFSADVIDKLRTKYDYVYMLS